MHNQHTHDHELEARFRREAEQYALSPQEKEQMRSVLRSYAQLKPVRSAREPRPIRQVSGWSMLFSARSAVALLVLLVIGSSAGVTSAAEASLPGDLLYPIKRRITEPVIQAVAVSPAAKAETATKLARRRLDEAAELSRQGRLADATREELTRDFEKHAESAAAVIRPEASAVALSASTTPQVSALERELADAEEKLERLSASTTELAPVIASIKEKKEQAARKRRGEEELPAIATSTALAVDDSASTTVILAEETQQKTARIGRTDKRTDDRKEEVRRVVSPAKKQRPVRAATTTAATSTLATSTATTTATTTPSIIESTIKAGERAGSYLGESLRAYLKRWNKERERKDDEGARVEQKNKRQGTQRENDADRDEEKEKDK